jgi:hypothetical protein
MLTISNVVPREATLNLIAAECLYGYIVQGHFSGLVFGTMDTKARIGGRKDHVRVNPNRIFAPASRENQRYRHGAPIFTARCSGVAPSRQFV